MDNGLDPQERAALASAMLKDLHTQLYRARFNVAMNVGDDRAVGELSKTVAQLERGITNVKALYAEDLSYKPPMPAIAEAESI